MARATHQYTDQVVDYIKKEGEKNLYQKEGLILVAVPVADKRYAISIIEQKFLRSSKGEFIIADNKTFKVILRKLSIYNKAQSIQFFYNAVNSLLRKELNKGQKIA